MKLFYFASISISIILCIACKSPIDDVKKDSVFYVDVDNIISTIDLKLSDIAENLKLVPLETNQESILGNCYYYINDRYILAFNAMEGIYKFSTNGSFNKKLISVGRGPHEAPPIFHPEVNDNLNLLIIEDVLHGNNKFLAYNLEHEKFLKPIQKSIPGYWKSFSFLNDSIIVASIITRLQKDSVANAMFFQNTYGELLSTVPANRRAIQYNNQKEYYQEAWITKGEERCYYKFVGDTLYTYDDNKFLPYVIIRFDNPKSYPPVTDSQKPGVRGFSFPRYENSSFSIIKESIVDRIEMVSSDGLRAYGRSYYFFLNKRTGNDSKVLSYTDDLINIKQESNGDGIDFPNILPNGKFYVVYYPHELKQLDFASMKSKAFSLDLYKQLESLAKNIDESDNPILLIGDVKDSIVLN